MTDGEARVPCGVTCVRARPWWETGTVGDRAHLWWETAKRAFPTTPREAAFAFLTGLHRRCGARSPVALISRYVARDILTTFDRGPPELWHVTRPLELRHMTRQCACDAVIGVICRCRLCALVPVAVAADDDQAEDERRSLRETVYETPNDLADPEWRRRNLTILGRAESAAIRGLTIMAIVIDEVVYETGFSAHPSNDGDDNWMLIVDKIPEGRRVRYRDAHGATLHIALFENGYFQSVRWKACAEELRGIPVKTVSDAALRLMSLYQKGSGRWSVVQADLLLEAGLSMSDFI